jgi:hypothetical protein
LVYERAAHAAGTQSRLHSGSAHLPGVARVEGGVEEPSPELWAVLTVVVVALAMVALVVAS